VNAHKFKRDHTLFIYLLLILAKLIQTEGETLCSEIRKKKTPWLESACELYRPKLVLTSPTSGGRSVGSEIRKLINYV
jgi:hypothetical protein